MKNQLNFIPDPTNKQNSKSENTCDFNTCVFKVYIDGASKGNPGQAGAGVLIVNKKNKEIIKTSAHLGEKTNNQAEYLALVLAAFLIKEQIADYSRYNFLFFSDSELLVKQMTGFYKVKDPILKKLQTLASSLLYNTNYTFKHIFRENNKIADKLANIGINKKTTLPKKFIDLLEKNHLFSTKE